MSHDYEIAEKRKRTRSWLIVLGVIAFVALIAVLKDAAKARNWLNSEPAAARLSEYRAAGKPVIVFFHSPDCSSCEQVQASLDEVYPEFKDSVVLLDADVTDMRERALVEQVGVQTAPTLLLVDASGAEKVIVGEISPQDLRTELSALAGGTP